MFTLSRNEILVLQELYKQGCTTEIRSLTTQKIAMKVELSYYSVRNTVKALLYGGYCAEGCKSGRASTYYITGKGIDVIERLREDSI